MCLDNSAAISVQYLNAQLGALWENAKTCSEACAGPTDFKSPEYGKTRHTRAFREFHYLTKHPATNLTPEELFFTAKFGRPQLKFICSHEAVLFLEIEEGRYNTEYQDSLNSGARAKA